MGRRAKGRGGHGLPFLARFALAGAVPLGGGVAVTLMFGPHAAVASTWALLALALLWPLLMLLVGVAGILLGALTGSDGLAHASGLAVEGGAEGFRYYAWLVTAGNPLLLGGIAGALLAVGGLYLYVEGLVKPKEEAARQQLARLAEKLRTHGEEAGRLPESTGAPLHKAFGVSPGDRWRDEDLTDPWGHPVLYECQTDIFGQRFRVLSSGWNGRAEDGDGDDLSAKGSLSGPGPAVRGLLDSIGRRIFGEEEEEKK